jgi:hypothetical protein
LDNGCVKNQENAKNREEGKFGKEPRLFGRIAKNTIQELWIVQRRKYIIDPISIHGILLH